MSVNRYSGSMLWGIVFILAGVAVLLSNLGYLPPNLWEQWWPLLLIILGLFLVIRRSTGLWAQWDMPSSTPQADEPTTSVTKRIRVRGRISTVGLFLIGIGIAFLLRGQLGEAVFPAFILITLGVVLLFR